MILIRKQYKGPTELTRQQKQQVDGEGENAATTQYLRIEYQCDAADDQIHSANKTMLAEQSMYREREREREGVNEIERMGDREEKSRANDINR